MKKINCYILSALTCFLVLTSPAQAAFDPTDTTTDYFKTSVDNWFDMGEALDPLTFTDFLTCLTKAAGAGQNALVNSTYKATADAARCETGASGSDVDTVKMIVRSSRANNLALTPQIVDIWFDGGPAEGSDPASHFVVEYRQTKGVFESTPRALTDSPYGAFTMNWKHETDTDAAPYRGSMSFAPSGNSTNFKMFQIQGADVEFINGSVKNDGSSGEAHTGYDGSKYLLKFSQVSDKFIVNVETVGGSTVCSDEDVVEDYVYDYNLYNEATGALKNLSGPFSGTYVDSSNNQKRIHAGPFGIWFEDQLSTDRYSITAIKHDDGTSYTGITYEPFDDGKIVTAVDGNGEPTAFSSCSSTVGGDCQAGDGVHVHIPSATAFDRPLIFAYADQTENASAAQAFMTTGRTVEYFGPGSLYGLPWQCKVSGTFIVDDQVGGCDAATDFKPLAAYPDFTVLIDNAANKWVTKGVTKESKMAAVAASVCNGAVDADSNNLGLGDLTGISTSYPALTSSFITSVNNTWAESVSDTTLKNATLRVNQGDNGENGQLIE